MIHQVLRRIAPDRADEARRIVDAEASREFSARVPREQVTRAGVGVGDEANGGQGIDGVADGGAAAVFQRRSGGGVQRVHRGARNAGFAPGVLAGTDDNRVVVGCGFGCGHDVWVPPVQAFWVGCVAIFSQRAH